MVKDPHLEKFDAIFKVNKISGKKGKLFLVIGESGRRKCGRIKLQEAIKTAESIIYRL